MSSSPPSRASIRAANLTALGLLLGAGLLAGIAWGWSPEGIAETLGEEGFGARVMLALSSAAAGDFAGSRQIAPWGPIAWIGLLSAAALGALVLLLNVLRFGLNRPEPTRWQPPGPPGSASPPG